MECDKGDLVWFDPGLGYVLPGEVLEFHRAGQVITVQAVIGGKSQVFTLTNLSSVRRRQDLGEDGVEDMISLGDLNEASLLWNLKIRYDKEKIYTYTGSILVAVNPYRMFDIYGLDIVKKYEGKILGTLSPHIFAIGSAAYSRMSKDSASQCVVISGESGAGKTESTKLIMQYLAAVNKSQSNLITEQILEASPLLESFGNAKTIKNDNSSRFGKYLECFFKEGVITGAKITEYLLEKSRIVTQAPDERNYHVYYELLAGLSKEKKAKYGLTAADKYFYLNQGGSCTLANKDDGEDFQALLSAMQVLGFSSDEQDTIFRILASVLHLGNVYFHRKQLRHGQEGVEIGSEAEIKWASHLLQIDAEGIRQALTMKITEFQTMIRPPKTRKEARHERLSTPLSIDQALDSRDAVAKALYSALFSWLVRRVNMIIHKGAQKFCISILDIFGFEVFKENSFEQLCINYANEKLQFYFNKHIFKLEQQEYAKEKIDWHNIDFQDNVPVIDLIARKPVGIIHLLDDESNFPKANDVSFLEKCHYNHALNELYSRPRMSSMEFGIKHYAGQVWYNVEGFLDKNRDTLRNDVVELLISSKLPMLSEMFIDVRLGSENKTLNKANGRFVTIKPRTPTVAARFNDSLSCLIELMSRSNPWFIRCIRPNHDKAPLKLDMPLVLEQLRYSGMLETIKIRQQGYPVRLRFSHFADRYRCLVPGQVPRGAPAKEICRVVLDRSLIKSNSRGGYQLGVNKIFLKESLEKSLEEERYKNLSHAVVTIQRHTRGLLARKKYNSYRKAATKVQTSVRMWQARTRYRTLRKGVIKAQAIVRGRKTRKAFEHMKEEAARRKKVEEMAKQRAARQAAQKEAQPERVQRSVAGVNHLEVPAELAYILSKTTDWQGPYKGHGHITRLSNPLQSESGYYRLPHDVDYHAFTKFTNVYFKSHLWGMKREPIKTPFLPKQRDSEYADSLAVFKLILRFMNDPSLAGTKETVLGNYIANKGIQNERMRDEILCQLSNQTWRNDNTANLERGWLLMANCLSVFPPSSGLYKYLLKYVSDHGYDGYANICQRKLLSSNKNSSGVARCFGPTELEWKANRTKSKMALTAHYPDGKTGTAEIDSWTTAEEFASNLLQERGINDSLGWSVTLMEHDSQTEITYLDYVLDLIGEKEVPPALPVGSSTVLHSDKSPPKHSVNTPQQFDLNKSKLEESPLVVRKTRSPPPLTRELSREALAAHDSRTSDGEETIGLSRTSALNNRYFDDKSKSRSLDNLIDSSPSNMRDLGLSGSKLNERYHSMERLTDSNTFTRVGPSVAHEFDQMESVSQRGADSEVIVSGSRLISGKGLEGSKIWSKYSLTEEKGVMENGDMKADYPKAVSSRFIKANNIGRRAYAGSSSSRAYIERGEYSKSSAMSDTSETPSLASHVRRVRVPSQASDVDQFLDDLFMPVLDHQLDELSDARSLAASIKGGSKDPRNGDNFSNEETLNELEEYVTFSSSREGSFRRQSLLNAFQDIPTMASLSDLAESTLLLKLIKGGGNGTAEVETNTPTTTSGAPLGGFYPGAPVTSGAPGSPPPFSPLTTVPLYSPGGITFPGMIPGPGLSPGQIDPNQYAAYQQNIQRAFLQSAVAQNIQIQQHLMAQNQALQQLIQQSVPHVGMSFRDQTPNSVFGINVLGFPPFGGMPITPQFSTPAPMMMTNMPHVGMHMNMSSERFRVPQGKPLDDTSNLKVSFQEPDHGDLWSTEKARGGSSSRDMMNNGASRGHIISPPPPLIPLGSPYSGGGLSFNQAVAASSPLPDQGGKKQSGASDDTRLSFEMASTPKGNARSPQPYQNEDLTNGDNHFGIVPPPPPMPTHLNHQDAAGNYLDPYQRAKTVRIGKWRWPPPKGEGEGGDSFFQFKLKQNNMKKSSKGDGKDLQKSNSRDESAEIEWEEFEFAEAAQQELLNSSSSKRENYAHMQQHNHSYYSNHQTSPHAFNHHQTSSHQTTTHQQQQLNHFLHQHNKEMNGDFGSDLFLLQKNQQLQYHKAVKQQRLQQRESVEKLENQSSKEWVETKVIKETKKATKKRKDSWDSDIEEEEEEEEEEKSAGIGKLKIPREMRQKLEALTSSHPSRISKGGAKHMKDRGVKKIEQSRRSILQQQLGGNRWDTVDSVRETVEKSKVSKRPPSPVVPVEGRNIRRPPSPSASVSSQESSPVIPQTRSPPPPIKPHGHYNHHGNDRIDFHYKERRASISTVQTEKTEQIEIEESSEFLKPVDRAPRIKDEEKEKKSVEGMKTRLLPPIQGAHLAYGKVPWTLSIRKEIFSPNETLSPDALHLVFCQIVLDVYGGTSKRLTSEERSCFKMLLNDYGITPNNTFSPHHKRSVKKGVVDQAKTCPLYFSSIFPVTGSRKIESVELLAVSHNGIKILKRSDGEFKLIETYSLEDIEEAKCSRQGSLHLFMTNGSGIVLYLHQAKQVSLLLTRFLSIIHAGSREFVRAVADYVTREPTLLSFRKGDIIRVTSSDTQYADKGWLHGVLDGRSGMFPIEYVTQIGRAEARLASKSDGIDPGFLPEKRSARETTRSPERRTTSPGGLVITNGECTSPTTWTKGSPPPLHHDDSGHSSGGEGMAPSDGSPVPKASMDEGSPPPKASVDDGKHSLLQFALQFFRGAKESGIADGSLQAAVQKAKKKKGSKDGAQWTWKDLVELVKFSQSPLKVSLLPLEGSLDALAVQTFTAIMRYMGDYPMDAQQMEVDCVYFILMHCHKHEALRDEVYCQVMKQTTNNKSSIPESCQRGWRLFSIIAAYFICSDVLKPYLLKYLETNAYDKRRAFHGTAMVCLQNIRKTFRYGGRKNVPSIEEITAITAGRNSKRQIYRLPGGTERVINTKSTSVVQDILEELCSLINVRSPQEQEEFSLYCIVEGDAYTLPLATEEYVLDVTTELLKNKKVFYLVFCRSVYYFPLRLDNTLYIEVVYNQIAPDYLAGFLLVTPGEHLEQDNIYDIAKISALMHRAADLDHIPTIKEVKYLLPRPLLKARDVKPPAWVSLVQGSWPEVLTLSSMEAKAAVLEILQNWPLFGSAFFDVERSIEAGELVPTILALNKRGVHFLDPVTHESILTFPLDKIMSTRKVKSNDGSLFLDMKCGNLMKPRIITLRTDQATEIARQMRQYIAIEQRFTGNTQGDNPRDVTLTR